MTKQMTASKELRAVLKFEQWMSTLEEQVRSRRHSRRTLEHCTDWLLLWEKQLVKNHPTEYSRLRKRERRLLTEAAQKMLRRYTRDLERKKRLHKLGTRARHDALQKFIYYFGRYLIQVLERTPPKLYRDAVKYAINNAIVEYSVYISEPEPFEVEYTTAILKSGVKLGVGFAREMYSRFEPAVVHGETLGDFMSKFPISWDQDLVSAMEGIFKNRLFSDSSLYDPLMMTISKLPEQRLSSYLEGFGIEKGELNHGASDLLSTAIHRNWIQKRGNEPIPLFYLLKWYFSELRNLPHHKFASYKYDRIRDAVLITNFVLNQLDSYAIERQSPI